MITDRCPKCGRKSLIKTLHNKVMKNNLHISDEYIINCINKKCNYKSEIIKENTKYGDFYDLPWYHYKRLFKILPK